MTLNASPKDIIAKRREVVASLLLRGYTQRGIVEALAAGYVDKTTGERVGRFLNPDTGEAYTVGTINGDVKALRREWAKKRDEHTDLWLADELAKLAELEREAWKVRNLELVLKTIDRRAKLLGLDAPTRVNLEGVIKLPADVMTALEALGYTPDLITETFRELVTAGMAVQDAQK